MRFTIASAAFILLSACGDDGGGGGGDVDAPNVPAMITLSGTASEKGLNTQMLSGVTIGAYRNSDPNTAVATTMSDASGNYTFAITTNGMPLDGYLKANLAGYIDTYLYPPKPLVADFSAASIYMITTETRDALSGALCGSAQMDANGAVAVLVEDATSTPVAGASISSQPAAAKYCYNGSNGFPDKMATATVADGIGYMLNLPPGEVTVAASKSGSTFFSHKVNARAGVLTTTLIQP